jgi:hypothetical protein
MFRIYRTPVEWIDQDTTRLMRSEATINLYEVSRWEICAERNLCSYDDKERTTVYYKNGQCEYIPISKEKFEAVMLDFLQDIGAIDTRSLPGGKEIVNLAKHHYRGPTKWFFAERHNAISVAAYPLKASIKTPEDIFINNLFGGITSLS